MSRDSINYYRKQVNDVPVEQFSSHQFMGSNAIAINYRMLSPVKLQQQSHPLVVVLHGSHAVGTDNVTQFPVWSSNYVKDADKQMLSAVPDHECARID